MKSVTLKIPDSLDVKIRRAVARRAESFSALARRALTREVEEHEVDFARLAAPYCGMFKGPRDLSSRVDAGPLIGWLNADDQWHAWSVSVLSARSGPLHTTEIVLGEACWHLGGNSQPAHALLDLVRKGALVLARPWPEHLAGTQQIMLKYPSMDAADASLVWLAELSPKAALVTTDCRHFQPCRGLRNRALKLILPE
ncbi:MAG: uncharacterized protein QOE70_2042 [Chthoniobacter sp.]|jgi:predicted nucleic acid-binding protein|nr:uncharacterized protein [Chthoniobacter sp.]